MTTDLDNQARLQDIRTRILQGEEPSAEEMAQLILDIRRDRRRAAPVAGARGGAKTNKATTDLTGDLMKSLLDMEQPGTGQ